MPVRQNYSRKRVAILETLKSTDVHPTAEWIYNELSPKFKDLSLGTVYRNVKKFCEDGKIRSVGVINGQEHFDGNVAPHSHLICQNCGKVLDMHRVFFSQDSLKAISDEYSFDIANEDVVFKGLCKDCRTV